MAKKTSPEMIEKINELYAILGVKSQVAKELGIAASTVTKYLIPDYKPTGMKSATKFNKPIDLNLDLFINAKDELGSLCALSEEEWADLKELQKEILI